MASLAQARDMHSTNDTHVPSDPMDVDPENDEFDAKDAFATGAASDAALRRAFRAKARRRGLTMRMTAGAVRALASVVEMVGAAAFSEAFAARDARETRDARDVPDPLPPSPLLPNVHIQNVVQRWGPSAMVGYRMEVRDAAWFVLPTLGDGGCLFITLRLAWELFEGLRQATAYLDATADGSARPLPPPPHLNGKAPNVVREAQIIRETIAKWLEKLHEPIKGGERFRVGPDARSVNRGDFVATHLIGDEGIDVPETTPEDVAALERADAARDKLSVARAEVRKRENLILEYLIRMRNPSEWGSTPEWRAFAYLTRLPFVTYTLPYAWKRLPNPELIRSLLIVPSGELRAAVPADLVEEAPALASAPVPSPESATDTESSESADEIMDEEPPSPFAYAGRLFFHDGHYVGLMTAYEFWILVAVHGMPFIQANNIVPFDTYLRQVRI
jgi:hypothetical protein